MGYFVAGGAVVASQQFGATQTDVFSVDQNGRLNVSWGMGERGWQAAAAIGPATHVTPGGFLAASQQLGANQTDVFFVDNNGQLNVFWIDGQGAWNGPEKIGPAGIAQAGTFLAASHQCGATQTDVFLVDKDGQLNVFWVTGERAWNGPRKIGAAGIASPGSFIAASRQFGADQTDVFLVDWEGQLNVFRVTGERAWSGPEQIGPTGIAAPGSFLAASHQFGADRTGVFLVDQNGQLNVFWVTGEGAWKGPERIGPAGIADPGSFLAASRQFGANQTNVFLVDKKGQLNVFSVLGKGSWKGPEKIGPAGNAKPGSFITASQQIGAHQTDVFLIDKNGQLSVF
ncbi:MAG: hypothetical protein ABSC06_15680 [Rhodopila sp.]|jgi:hypothetical protein